MDAKQMASLWANDVYFDAETRNNAATILTDEEQILSAFGSELAFGTGGLRGILGTGTTRMNRHTVARATLGLAKYLNSNFKNPSVVIAHDSRHGSEEFTAVSAAVLNSQGIRTHVFPQLAPTPMLSFAVRELKASAGIMITASHNPAIYNGYKVYGSDGCQITDHAAAEITKQIESCTYTQASLMTETDARAQQLFLDVDNSIREAFTVRCLACRANPSVDAPIHIVYTPLHGTGLMPVREVLARMKGVTVTEVEAQCSPDGSFPTCPKPNPEINETLSMGIALAKETQAELLLATDPDCDRVGVAVRKPDGTYARLSGNEVGLLLLDFILSTRKAEGNLPANATVVKTIVTSDLAFPIATKYGVTVKEVLTGFKYIGEVIGGLEAANRVTDYVFGFEESCGYLAGTHVRDKDGVMACMLVCEMAQTHKANGKSVYQALQELYAEYGCIGTSLLSFDIAGALPMEKMKAAMVALRTEPIRSLAGQQVTMIKDYLTGIDGLPSSDVLVYEANNVKAIVRPSGTEPKVKVYLSAKACNLQQAAPLLITMEEEIRAKLQL